MFAGRRNSLPSGSVMTVLKILVGIGIFVVVLGLILFFNGLMSELAVSIFLQLTVDGAIIMGFSYLAIQVFRGLEYV